MQYRTTVDELCAFLGGLKVSLQTVYSATERAKKQHRTIQVLTCPAREQQMPRLCIAALANVRNYRNNKRINR